MVFTFDYYHKDIKDVLTVRATNLAFEARMPGHGNELVPGTGSTRIESFGPWGEGTYDGFTIGFQKRMSHNFTLQANYTFTHGIDNVLNSTLTSEIQNGEGVNFLAIAGLSDSFVGKVPVVTDGNGQTNADGCRTIGSLSGSYLFAPWHRAATVEFFNLFNKGNVAAVQSLDGTSPVFGSTL